MEEYQRQKTEWEKFMELYKNRKYHLSNEIISLKDLEARDDIPVPIRIEPSTLVERIFTTTSTQH